MNLRRTILIFWTVTALIVIGVSIGGYLMYDAIAFETFRKSGIDSSGKVTLYLNVRPESNRLAVVLMQDSTYYTIFRDNSTVYDYGKPQMHGDIIMYDKSYEGLPVKVPHARSPVVTRGKAVLYLPPGGRVYTFEPSER